MKFLLYPLSLLYSIYSSFRNLLFDLGLIDSIEYKIPTIGIGNLSTGGTGKSIIVDYLIEKFKKNKKITTLSRGYNRKTKGFVHASKSSDAYEIGDEPFQFFSKHPEINVVVCEDRRKGMNIILKNLVEAGVHFGHKSQRWNPKMSKYIHSTRENVHIIDLNHTVQMLKSKI